MEQWVGYTKTVSRQFWVKRSWSKYACGHFSASMPVVLFFQDVFKTETISSSVDFFFVSWDVFFCISGDFLCLQSTSKMSNDRFILLDDFVQGVYSFEVGRGHPKCQWPTGGWVIFGQKTSNPQLLLCTVILAQKKSQASYYIILNYPSENIES